MNHSLQQSTKWITCTLCWLTISPLFYYLAKRWALVGKKLRVTLLVISPLFIATYFITICLIGLFGIEYYQDHRYDYRSNVEKMIELPPNVHMPRYKVVKFEKGRRSFNGDHTNSKAIEFKALPSEQLYNTLDSLSNLEGSNWNVSHKDTLTLYCFGTSWQNGRLVRQGHFSIEITKWNKTAYIEYGAW